MNNNNDSSSLKALLSTRTLTPAAYPSYRGFVSEVIERIMDAEAPERIAMHCAAPQPGIGYGYVDFGRLMQNLVVATVLDMADENPLLRVTLAYVQIPMHSGNGRSYTTVRLEDVVRSVSNSEKTIANVHTSAVFALAKATLTRDDVPDTVGLCFTDTVEEALLQGAPRSTPVSKASMLSGDFIFVLKGGNLHLSILSSRANTCVESTGEFSLIYFI